MSVLFFLKMSLKAYHNKAIDLTDKRLTKFCVLSSELKKTLENFYFH